MNSTNARYAGLLLHLTSLPSPYGIGDLGPGAYQVADWLKDSGLTLWQILPTCPTGYGNSPYAPRSSFAANELLIDLEDLVGADLLDQRQIAAPPVWNPNAVNYDGVRSYKMPLLKRAAAAFLAHGGRDQVSYQRFVAENSHWLAPYALFQTLVEHFGDSRWISHWPAPYAQRDRETLARFEDEHRHQLEVWQVLQYFFELQWSRFRAYVNERGIRLIGDVPIFVAGDSCDTWQHRELFKRNSGGFFDPVSGVPPDIFSATGQLWGNPVYDWKANREDGFRWWIDRLKRLFTLTDLVRIDHFRGFEATYEIPANHPTAEFGRWVKADGAALFETIRREMGKLDIIAEDLGLMNDEVIALRDGNNFVGMKILQFGFTLTEEGEPNYHDDFLPHNWAEPFVAYTGTHDNDTTLGWYRSLSAKEKRMVRTYLGCTEKTVVEAMIGALFQSHARIVIVPMQDILKYGSEARFNYPSTCNDQNWSWRLRAEELTGERSSALAQLAWRYGRDGRVVPSAGS